MSNRIQTGNIPLTNQHGIDCWVGYHYDETQDDFVLIPDARFNADDVKRAIETMPNFIKAMIVTDTIRDLSSQGRRPPTSSCAHYEDIPVCGFRNGIIP
jgi:hypothetical protein